MKQQIKSTHFSLASTLIESVSWKHGSFLMQVVIAWPSKDSALAPCPKDLMAALARWPKCAKPTAALMASLQRARGSVGDRFDFVFF